MTRSDNRNPDPDELPPDRRPVDGGNSSTSAGDDDSMPELSVGHDASNPGSEDLTTPPSSKAPDSRRVGPFKILQLIAEGGMGAVYMAEQEEPIRRRVALKVIKAGQDSQQIITRFEAERQALAMMNHENIARVLDAGTADDGSPWFAMELVKGIPLTEYCDKNRLSIRERLQLFIPVCKGIQHAHQKGIIHRDLKPSNVLVALYDGVPVPKVIDFGLAKATEHQHRLTDKTMFTEFGQVVGTLQYMSPEQAEMNQLDVDTRTDIYSLGVMLYELLVGSTPLDRQTMANQALLGVLELIREKEPPRPSTRLSESGDAVTGVSEQRKIEAAQLQKVLRGELDWVVMKSLEKDRSRRYETATAFAHDVQRFLDDETVAARPQSTGYRMQKFVRKHRGVVASLVTIAALLMAGIAGTSWYAWEASQSAERERIARQEAQENEILARENEQLAKDRELEAKREAKRANKATDIAKKKEAEARLQRKIAEERDRTSRAMVSFFEDDLLKFANPWNLILKETGAGEYSIREVLDAAASKFSPDPSELTMPADAYCSILLVIANTYEGLGEYEKMMEYVNGAHRIASKHFPKSNPIVIKTKLYVGFSKLLMSRRAEAINEFTDIYFLLAKLVEKAIDTEQGSLEKRIARTAMLTYLETLLQRCDYQVRTLPEWNEDSRIKLNWGLTRIFLARSSFPKFIENATQLYGPDDDIVIYMKAARGLLEFAFRDFDRSREIFEDVLVAAEKKHAVGEDGEDSVAMMGIKQVLTMAYTQLDRHPEKQVAFSESVFQSMERKFGINHPGTMGAVKFLINTLRRNDKQAEMVPYLKIQNRVHCQELGELHADSITVLENYAETLWNLKQERAAIDLLTERMQLIPDSPTGREIGESLVVTLYTMGQTAMKRKQPQLAVDCLLPTWQFEKTIFPNSWSTFDTQSLLGAAQYENGEIKKAITNMLQGCEGLQNRRESLPKDETFYRDSVARLVKYYEKENDEPNAILWQKALKEIKQP